VNVPMIGMDRGKTTFHLIGMDEHSSIFLKKRFSRLRLMKFLVNLPPGLIGMEASCDATMLVGLLEFGQDVRLIPA
jgi:transposase